METLTQQYAVDLDFLNEREFEQRTRWALEWLKKSIDVNGGHGSSAYFSQLYKPFTWSKAYPETTGYIIATLFDYESLYPDMQLREYALRCADWICGLQLDKGALPGGLAGSQEPSVFNTGQMLIGLNRAYEETGDPKYLQVIDGAVNWLLSILEEDGSWTLGAYVEGHVPSYYTRVVWPVLWANQHLQRPEITSAMEGALAYYRQKITSKLSVEDWSFRRGQKAFTHTIAYTIRGFYESSLLLDDESLNLTAIQLAEKVLKLREIRGQLAGWYDEKWNGGYWFTCLTGNAQMSIIFSKIYAQTGDLRFLNTSLKLFSDIMDYQQTSGKNTRGAIAGSSPFYGRYLTLRYPNWATKFYLDAYLLMKRNVEGAVGSE